MFRVQPKVHPQARWLGSCVPRYLFARGMRQTPLLAQKQVFGGLVLLAISNPSAQRTPASAFRGRERMRWLVGRHCAWSAKLGLWNCLRIMVLRACFERELDTGPE